MLYVVLDTELMKGTADEGLTEYASRRRAVSFCCSRVSNIELIIHTFLVLCLCLLFKYDVEMVHSCLLIALASVSIFYLFFYFLVLLH